MPLKDKNKIIRILLSALLDSDLGQTDLRQLALDLEDGRLAGDLARALDSFLNASDLSYSSKAYQPYMGAEPAAVRKVLDAIKRKRLSKAEVMNAMTTSGRVRISPEGTMKELVTRYLQMSTDAEAVEFVAKIVGPSSADPFLKGIANR
jgi:hypothetical protein